MVYEANNDNIIIQDSNNIPNDNGKEDEPPVILYNDQTEQSNIEQQTSSVKHIDINALSMSISVSSADLSLKVKTFIDIFGPTMEKLKKEQPETWSSMVVKLRKDYQEDPYKVTNVIDLLAALTIEYKYSLMNDEIIDSLLSHKLYEILHQDQAVKIDNN